MPRPDGVLLAAGRSQRFGGNKLISRTDDGTPLVLAAARNLASAVERLIVVIRPGDIHLERLLLAEGLITLCCPSAERGMGESLAFGVSRIRRSPGCIVALADMPYINPETIKSVADRLSAGAEITAPFYQGVRGHPVGFGVKYFSELTSLTGDRGARNLLSLHAAEITRIDVNDPGILRDIDYPEQLEFWKAGQV